MCEKTVLNRERTHIFLMVHKKDKPAAEQERGREMEKILKTQNERHRKRKQLSENGKERERRDEV